MAIMAAQGQSDARGAAWLLADIAFSSLDNPENSSDHAVELNNAYRLIRAYRNNPLFGLQRDTGVGDEGDTMSLGSSADSNALGVRDAMRKASTSVYQVPHSKQILDRISDTLRMLVNLGSKSPIADPEFIEAKRFFGELRSNLA